MRTDLVPCCLELVSALDIDHLGLRGRLPIHRDLTWPCRLGLWDLQPENAVGQLGLDFIRLHLGRQADRARQAAKPSLDAMVVRLLTRGLFLAGLAADRQNV